MAWSRPARQRASQRWRTPPLPARFLRSEEHTSELQSLRHLVCRLLLENRTATSQTYTLSLHDALPICGQVVPLLGSTSGKSWRSWAALKRGGVVSTFAAPMLHGVESARAAAGVTAMANTATPSAIPQIGRAHV